MSKILFYYKDDKVATKAEADILKGNIKYFRTMINTKLLKDILPLKNKIIKIKVGKSGLDPLSFNDQIIMPIKTKTLTT